MKKLLSLLLVAVLVLSVTSLSVAAYSDTSSHWGKAAIDQWGSLLVSNTSGKFEPDAQVTRAEFAHVVNSIVKYPAATPTFTDVAGNAYASDIGALQKAGVVEGVVAGKTFAPNAPITRQSAAKILGIAFGLPASGSATTFADDASIPAWAKPYIDALKTVSYMNGVDGNRFAPTTYLTRAEIVTIAYNVNPGKQVKNANYVVTSAGTIKDQTFNNLIISAGITGEVVLENVTVNGSVIVLGATGTSGTSSYAAAPSTSKAVTLGNSISAAVESYANPKAAFSLSITGTSNIGQLFVQSVASVTINATVKTVVVQSSVVTVTVGSAGVITTVIVSTTSTSTEITNGGKITTLTVFTTETTIINNGSIAVFQHVASVVLTGTPAEKDETVVPSANDIYA